MFRAQHDPDRLAFADQTGDLTYAELLERAGGRAAGLHAMGVGPGDRVAVVMASGVPFVEVFWALQLLGAAPCVLNPAAPDQTLARRVELLEAKLVVTDAVASEMRLLGAGTPAARIDPDQVAFLQLTSGTCGDPRASVILHRNVLAYLRNARKGDLLGPDDVFVSWVPPWHDLGLVAFVISSVYHGAGCHIVEPAVRTIPQWLTTITRVAGTYSAAPDFALRLAARMVDPATVDLSSLRSVTSGGEPVRWSSIQAFEERFKLPGVIRPGYGLGEATLGVTSHVPGEHVPVDERGNVSCGPVNRGLEVRAGRSADSPGEIVIRGETVFAGYLNAPEETARVLNDGWLHTGDCGYLDAQGRLYVLGRRMGMIKRAASLFAPREIEEAAQRASGVRVAAATSVPSGRHDDEIVVAVELNALSDRPAEQIAADVSSEVVGALGFAPGRICILPRGSIPRTENGKIRHARLRALVENEAGQAGSSPPVTRATP
jgi:acyl-CoA synthetase (AMP-forming)/AMP-acid ligase II